MKKAWVSASIVTGAGIATAATFGLSAGLNSSTNMPTITVITGAAGVSAASTFATSTPEPVAAACTVLTASAGTTDPAPGTTGCGLPSHVTLEDRVWFGTYWQLLPTSIVLGGGYTSARIDRSNDGAFFDGIVEKVDASGRSAPRRSISSRRSRSSAASASISRCR